VLARYCENAPPEAEARAVEAHLRGCAPCRSAEAEVRRGIAWAGALEPVALPERDAARIRQKLVEGRSRSVPWRWAAAAAALVVLAAGLAQGIRGRLTVEPAAGPPTPFEQAALDLHDRHAAGRLALDLRSSSVPEVRRWAAGWQVGLADGSSIRARALGSFESDFTELKHARHEAAHVSRYRRSSARADAFPRG